MNEVIWIVTAAHVSLRRPSPRLIGTMNAPRCRSNSTRCLKARGLAPPDRDPQMRAHSAKRA